MKAEGMRPEAEADGEPALAVGLATAPAEDRGDDVPAELVAVELAVAVPLLPVPQPLLSVPPPETDVTTEIVAAPAVVDEPAVVAEAPVMPAEPVVVAEAPVMPAEPAVAPEVQFAGQAERFGWLRRLRSLIALIFLAALLGATLAAVVIGIGVLIALAAQHALG